MIDDTPPSAATGSAHPPRLAGFWRRAAGALLDAVVVAALTAIAVAVLMATGNLPEYPRVDLANPALPPAAGALVLAVALYDVVTTRRWGGTLGKRIAGVRVVARDGGPAGTGQLVGRLLGRVVSAAPALLGFVWCGWDRRKQTWHDKLADTVVVDDDAEHGADVGQAAGEAAHGGDAAGESPWAPAQQQPSHIGAGTAPVEVERAAPLQPVSVWEPAAQPTSAPPLEQWAAPQQQPGAWSAPQQAPAVQASERLTAPPPPAAHHDPNLDAITRAGLGRDAAVWLQQVAQQVDARLDRVSAGWRGSPHAESARACVFGLLLAHLAGRYPHMRPVLHATAEAHPSFTTLVEGGRLATLEQIAADAGRMAAWVGPLIDMHEPARVRDLLD